MKKIIVGYDRLSDVDNKKTLIMNVYASFIYPYINNIIKIFLILTNNNFLFN